MKKVVSYLTILVVCLFTFVSFVNAEEEKTVVAAPTTEKNSSEIVIPDGKIVVYVGRETCGFCKAFEPSLKYLSKKYNFEYKYVDIEKITDDEYNAWMKVFDIDPNKLGTPTFGAFINKELKNKNEGYLPEKELFDFLKANGIIEENAEFIPQYKKIKYVNDQEYLDVVKSNKKSLIVLTQVTNAAGYNSKDTLEELAQKYNIDIYYYNLGFSSQEDFDKFVQSNKYIEDNINSLSLPTYLIIQGDKMIDVTNSSTKDGLTKFFNANYGIHCTLIIIIVLSVLLAASLTFNVIFFLKLRKNNKDTNTTNNKTSKKIKVDKK